MIEAILNKAMSADILPNYAKLLKTVSKNFQTNMTTKEITSLCKMQLDDMSQWTIKYANAKGTGAMKTTFAYQSRKLYVCVPDYSSVEKITKKIKKTLKAMPGDADDDKSDAGKSDSDTSGAGSSSTGKPASSKPAASSAKPTASGKPAVSPKTKTE